MKNVLPCIMVILALTACGDDTEPDDTGTKMDSRINNGDSDVAEDADRTPDADSGAVDASPTETAEACRTWAEGLDSEDDGATRDFYNAGVGLRWRNFLGDWVDANGMEQGDVPYASASLIDDDTPEIASFDVTALVQQWVNEGQLNRGFFLRRMTGGPFRFGSREHSDMSVRPRLILMTPDGEETVEASADTYLRESTFQSAGEEDVLGIRDGESALIRFDLDALTQVSSAVLEVTSVAEFGGGIEVGVFEAAPGSMEATAVQTGVAAGFADDANIEAAASVIFAENFEDDNWGEGWTSGTDLGTLIDSDSGFESLSGRALKVTVPEGENTGLNLRYYFMEEIGEEPDAIYFRYYLRIAESWQPTFGGKLPGTAGTYGVAGWGGRRVDGTDGWSARGQYDIPAPVGNPFANHTPIGNYVYHADMESQFGDGVYYDCGGLIGQNRWYSVEQYVQLNTPGENDGIIRAWVDGRLVEEKTDWRWRDVDSLHIENIWMNVYHGGTATAPQDMVLYIDNVVISREYIGPRKQP